MIKILRTNSKNKDFVKLVSCLDSLLAEYDGREHDFYDQYNKIDKIEHVVVAYFDGVPVACGAIKKYDNARMEVKRMFTLDEYRGRGIASVILAALEQWTKDLGYSICILETGRRLPEAVRLYQRSGYQQIPNYGQYIQMENSICFEKNLNKD